MKGRLGKREFLGLRQRRVGRRIEAAGIFQLWPKHLLEESRRHLIMLHIGVTGEQRDGLLAHRRGKGGYAHQCSHSKK